MISISLSSRRTPCARSPRDHRANRFRTRHTSVSRTPRRRTELRRACRILDRIRSTMLSRRTRPSSLQNLLSLARRLAERQIPDDEIARDPFALQENFGLDVHEAVADVGILEARTDPRRNPNARTERDEEPSLVIAIARALVNDFVGARELLHSARVGNVFDAVSHPPEKIPRERVGIVRVMRRRLRET